MCVYVSVDSEKTGKLQFEHTENFREYIFCLIFEKGSALFLINSIAECSNFTSFTVSHHSSESHSASEEISSLICLIASYCMLRIDEITQHWSIMNSV